MMTPRSRKPVLLVSGTNITVLPKMENKNSIVDNIIEESSFCRSEQPLDVKNLIKSKSESDLTDMKTDKIEKMNKSDSPTKKTSLSDIFKEYLNHRDMITLSSPIDTSFSSRTDDFNSSDFQNLGDDKMSDSLLYCLNGNQPDDITMSSSDKEEEEEKELVLKPKQFDKDGKIIFETSF